ncbi:MAG: single-stranded-DNA-specific exonuclease RecJ [Ferruginibacter sp.]
MNLHFTNMSSKRWHVQPVNAEKVKLLQEALKINPALCALLVQRGIDNFEAAKAFFRPQLSALHDPFLMKDMDVAVNRILTAFKQHEKILVFGDYDVDGTTSVASMYQFLQSIYDTQFLDYYIPHRYREGYGVSKMGIDYAAANQFSLIISLDCGIKSVELIAYAKTLGIDFIVCDHHLPDEIVPAAVAILNAKQKDCTYPYKDLCGCGVGFKLMMALTQTLALEENYYLRYLDLVATAIAADIVPMTGENRILAYYGLKKINENPCPGIQVLIEKGNLKHALNITNVVFVIAPRVNAAGRMDDAKKAVQLFIEQDQTKAAVLGEILNTDNQERKTEDQNITEEALHIIDNDENLIKRKTTVLYKEHWHKGVVGIVASRLTEKYFRPTVVLTRSGDIATGSARSVPGFNLYEAIHACKEHLLSYGGHFAAAGLSLLPSAVEKFNAAFETHVAATIDEALLTPVISIDHEISFTDVTPNFYNILCQMEPFGPDNMRPIFMTKGVKNTGRSKIVKAHHIRFECVQKGVTITGIGFNMAEKFDIVENGQPFDILFTLDENEYNHTTTLQLKVVDIRPSSNTNSSAL